jgi:hypothetical protein
VGRTKESSRRRFRARAAGCLETGSKPLVGKPGKPGIQVHSLTTHAPHTGAHLPVLVADTGTVLTKVVKARPLPSSKEMTLVEGSRARADTATSGTEVHSHIALTGLLCSLKLAETEKASVMACRAGAGGEAGGRGSGVCGMSKETSSAAARAVSSGHAPNACRPPGLACLHVPDLGLPLVAKGVVVQVVNVGLHVGTRRDAGSSAEGST